MRQPKCKCVDCEGTETDCPLYVNRALAAKLEEVAEAAENALRFVLEDFEDEKTAYEKLRQVLADLRSEDG